MASDHAEYGNATRGRQEVRVPFLLSTSSCDLPPPAHRGLPSRLLEFYSPSAMLASL